MSEPTDRLRELSAHHRRNEHHVFADLAAQAVDTIEGLLGENEMLETERDRYRDAIAAYQAVYDDTESREPWEYDAAADELFATIGQTSAWRAGS